jgi:protein TonB
MREYLHRREREARQRAAQRRRDLALAAGAVLFHAVLLLLLPGFSAAVHAPPVLYVELAQAQPSGAQGVTAIAPLPAPIPQGPSLGGASAKAAQAGAQRPAAHPSKPGAPAKVTQPAKPRPGAERGGQSAPQVVLPGPSVPEQIRPEKPIQNTPEQKPDKVAPPAPAQPAKPADQPGSPGANGSSTGGEPGGNAGGAGDASGGKTEPGAPGTAGQAGPPAAPDAGPPAPPPGPSAHELSLLGDYGNKALRRIKSQARNSEEGARGTVVFEFAVDRKGRLLDVRVVESSGHNNLDNDVLEAARAAFNERYEIIPFPADVSLDKWVFKKSITYPLY